MKGDNSRKSNKRSNSDSPQVQQAETEIGSKFSQKQNPNGATHETVSEELPNGHKHVESPNSESTPTAESDSLNPTNETDDTEMNMEEETTPVEVAIVDQNGVTPSQPDVDDEGTIKEVDECNNNNNEKQAPVVSEAEGQIDEQQQDASEESQVRTVEVIVKNGIEDDIPLGSEAHSLNEEKGLGSEKYPPVDKRLGWLMGNTENVSFTSDQSQITNTSTSSDISLDMLLQERSADPEEILTSLGFVGSEETDSNFQRVPERFLSQPSAADGIDFTDEIKQLLELSDNEDLIEQITSQQNSDIMNQGNPHLNNMLASVMNGMKFLSAINHSHSMNLSIDSKCGEENTSIMQNPKNREFLEKQGFYSKFVSIGSPKTDSDTEDIKAKSVAKLMKSKSVDASERRKRFQSMKSKNYTRSIADSDTSNTTEMSSVTRSFDNGLQMKSFGQSFEMSDSFDSVEGQMKQSHMEDLEVFRNDDDDDIPQRPSISLGEISQGLMNKDKFPSMNDSKYRTKAYDEGLKKMRELRESQVERHMSLLDQEEDYVISPPVSKQSSFEATLTQQDLRNYKNADNDSGENGDTKKLNNGHKSVTFSDTDRIEAQNKKVLDTNGESENTDNSEKTASEVNAENDESDADSVCLPVEEINKMVTVTTYSAENGDITHRNIHSDNTRTYPERNLCLSHVLSVDDKDLLGGMGRMESIQSDSSGFADGDMITDHALLDTQERVSSLGSSVESDSTFRSSITVLGNPDMPNSPRLPLSTVEFPNGSSVNKPSRKSSNGRRSSHGGKVDVAVSTEDLNLLADTNLPSGTASSRGSTPSITYHLHQKEIDDSGNDNAANKSVILTIELPNDWLKDSEQKNIPKASVVSHLYKYIGEPKSSSHQQSGRSQNDTNRTGSKSRSEGYPTHNTRPSSNSLRGDNRGKTFDVHSNWASTPCVSKKQHYKMSDLNPRFRPPKKTLFNSREGFRPISPRNYSSFSDFRFMPPRTASEDNRSESENSSHASFSNEINTSFLSAGESFSSLQDENIEYVKLLRLVNRPLSSKENLGRQTAVHYNPKHHVKSWSHLDRRQYMEEETKLMQQALQKYKIELGAMETVFHVNSQLAGHELTLDEREDIEELQHIWSEVQREISETEQLLANRLGGLVMGNDNFNPLLALEIIHKMTELIREQLFQHEVSLEKDEDVVAAMETNSLPWYSGVPQQPFDLQQNFSRPHSVYGDGSLHESLTELRDSILSEVKQELHESTQWLQRELQGKDRELNRLRMELMTSSIKSGGTRRKHYYESDV